MAVMSSMPMLPSLAWGLHDRGNDVAVDVWLSRRFPPALKPRLKNILAVFGTLAETGMLSGQDPAFTEPGFVLAQPQPVAADSAGLVERWSIGCRQLDPGTYRLLLNALHHGLSSAGDAAEGIGLSIQSLTAGPATEVHMSALKEVAYPLATSRLPFPLDDNWSEPLGRELMMRVDLASPMTEAALDHVEKGLHAWQQLLLFGGFADTDGQAGPPFTHAEWYRVSEHTGEYALYNWNAPAEAMDLVLNLLASVHHRIGQIAMVELE